VLVSAQVLTSNLYVPENDSLWTPEPEPPQIRPLRQTEHDPLSVCVRYLRGGELGLEYSLKPHIVAVAPLVCHSSAQLPAQQQGLTPLPWGTAAISELMAPAP
jgi:hypothetical protein